MPFRARGKTVQVKRGDKWVKKQTCRSEQNAHKVAGMLNKKYGHGEIK